MIVPRSQVYADCPARGSWVYFLFQDGKCLYIGSSRNLEQRLIHHRHKPFTHVRLMRVPRRRQFEVENRLIRRYRPEMNSLRVLWKPIAKARRPAKQRIVFRLTDAQRKACEAKAEQAGLRTVNQWIVTVVLRALVIR